MIKSKLNHEYEVLKTEYMSDSSSDDMVVHKELVEDSESDDVIVPAGPVQLQPQIAEIAEQQTTGLTVCQS